MAKMTKETMLEKLGALEDKLFDFVPENEEGTARAGVLNKVSEIVSGNVKATLAEMREVFNEGTSLLAVEAEVKKQTKTQSSKKVSEPKKDAVEEETSDEEPVAEEKPKKKVIKSKSSKTSEKKEEEKESSKTPAKKEEKFKFPNELETKEDGTYKLTNIRGLHDINEGDLIACQWTKEDLKNYDYDEIGVFGTPTEFEKDIDVLLVVDVFEDKIAYASSLGTHKMYHFLKEDVKNMISVGMPWRVYKPVE